ncbi:vanadium-dependent haloperoxidase [Polaribacter sp.]|uniref:vanadium-dependent haloperoxidase n=1 Tax=Polaribacter sp. TaxID=1920175 RepID=UPI003F6D42F1
MYLLKKTLTFFLFVLMLFSCQEKENITITSQDYHNVVDHLTSVMIHDIFSPPVASRIYAYPNIASYEILNSNAKDYKPLGEQLNKLLLTKTKDDKKVDKKIAALIGYLEIARELVFSKEKVDVYRDSLYNSWQILNNSQFSNAKNYANPFIKNVLNYIKTDNYKETRNMPDFNISSKNPGRWEPTPPAYMKGIEPHWNKIRPFLLDSASQFKPVPPPAFSMEKESKFYKELKYVYDLTNQIKQKGNNSEELKIAQFWDCNPYVAVNKGHFMFAAKKITPGAHWIGICKIATKKTNSNFSKTVFAYTKTSIAIADAFISCWDEKYRSNLVRPETLINKFIDDTWAPLLQTPPFPEYTSGHSVVSGAAAEVLTNIFGENFSFEDTTEIPYGLPMRKFASFRNAAKEAAISRIYGGIHYEAAVNEGLTQGIQVGKFVNKELTLLK